MRIIRRSGGKVVVISRGLRVRMSVSVGHKRCVHARNSGSVIIISRGGDWDRRHGVIEARVTVHCNYVAQ